MGVETAGGATTKLIELTPPLPPRQLNLDDYADNQPYRSSSFSRACDDDQKVATFPTGSIGWHPTCATSHTADWLTYDIDDSDILSMSAADNPQAAQSDHHYQREGSLVAG